MAKLINIAKLTDASLNVYSDVPFDICSYCSRTLTKDNITKDHITPRSQGGRGSDNYATSCYDCNQAKADLDLLTFLLLQPTLSKAAKNKARKQARKQARLRARHRRQHTTLKATIQERQQRLDTNQMAVLRMFRSNAANLVISKQTREELARM